MALSLALLALLATATAGSPAAWVRPGCSDFQRRERNTCIDCPDNGFARLPLKDRCLDPIEVLSAHAGRLSETRRNDQTSSALQKSVDRIREDTFSPEESSQSTIGSRIEYVFGSEDMKKLVEKIVLWKRNGSCAMNVDDFEFESHAFCMGCSGSNCWPMDKGPYVQLICKRMFIHGFAIQRRSGNMTNCDVPAEVEVYGSWPNVVRLENASRL